MCINLYNLRQTDKNAKPNHEIAVERCEKVDAKRYRNGVRRNGNTRIYIYDMYDQCFQRCVRLPTLQRRSGYTTVLVLWHIIYNMNVYNL